MAPEATAQARPDLVIVYGPNLEPSYAEMVEIARQCEAKGQHVLLIPAPDANGKSTIDPAHLTPEQVSAALAKEYPPGSDKAYTLYLYTHGNIVDGEHISSLGRDVNTRRLVTAALEHGRCQGIYDASCYSGATITQVSEEIVRYPARLAGGFEFVTDAPMNDTAAMDDSAVFLKKLPEYLDKKLPLTPGNMQRLYQLSLGDTPGVDSAVAYRKVYGLQDRNYRKDDVIAFEDMGDKLDYFLSHPSSPKRQQLSHALDQLVSPAQIDRIFELAKASADKNTLLRENLWGEAMLVADALYPDQRKQMTPLDIRLANSKAEAFAMVLMDMPIGERDRYLREHPARALENIEILQKMEGDPRLKETLRASVRALAGDPHRPAQGANLSHTLNQWSGLFTPAETKALLLEDARSLPPEASKYNINDVLDFWRKHPGDSETKDALIDRLTTAASLKPDTLSFLEKELPRQRYESIMTRAIKREIETDAEQGLRSLSNNLEAVSLAEFAPSLPAAFEKVTAGNCAKALTLLYPALEKDVANRLAVIAHEKIKQGPPAHEPERAYWHEDVLQSAPYLASIPDAGGTIRKIFADFAETHNALRLLPAVADAYAGHLPELTPLIAKNLRRYEINLEQLKSIPPGVEAAPICQALTEHYQYMPDGYRRISTALSEHWPDPKAREAVAALNERMMQNLLKYTPEHVLMDKEYFAPFVPPLAMSSGEIYSRAAQGFAAKLASGKTEDIETKALHALASDDRWLHALPLAEQAHARKNFLHAMAGQWPQEFLENPPKWADPAAIKTEEKTAALTIFNDKDGYRPDELLIHADLVARYVAPEKMAAKISEMISQDRLTNIDERKVFSTRKQWDKFLPDDGYRYLMTHIATNPLMHALKESDWIDDFKKRGGSLHEMESIFKKALADQNNRESCLKSNDWYRRLCDFDEAHPKAGERLAQRMMHYIEGLEKPSPQVMQDFNRDNPHPYRSPDAQPQHSPKGHKTGLLHSLDHPDWGDAVQRLAAHGVTTSNAANVTTFILPAVQDMRLPKKAGLEIT